MKTSISERSPLSPRTWPADAFVWWRSLLFAFGLALAVVVPVSIVEVYLFLNRVLTARDLSPSVGFSWPLFGLQLFTYVIPTAILVLVLPRLARVSLADLGFRAPRAADFGWGVAGAIAMVAVVSVVGALEQSLLHIKPDELQVHWLRTVHGGLLIAFIFLACVAAPVFEEIVFRGFLFNALLRYLPLWLAVILSSAAFGAVHGIGIAGNGGALIPLAASGVVLALVYYYRRSLAASMITHGLFNAITVVLVVAFHQS